MANNYNHTDQAARGVALLDRTPGNYSLRNPQDVNKGLLSIGVHWPVYKNTAFNLHHNKGPVITGRETTGLVPGNTGAETYFAWGAMWTNAARVALTPSNPLAVRKEAAAFARVEGLDAFKSTQLYTDNYPAIADSVDTNPQHVTYHILPTLKATGYAIGVDAFNEWVAQPTTQANGVTQVSPKYNYFNSELQEVPAGGDYAELMSRLVGQLIKAFNESYISYQGTKPAYPSVWLTDTTPTWNTEAHYNSGADSNGNPAFMSNTPPAYADVDLMKALNDCGGYVSHDNYQKCIWGPAMDYFQYDTNGNVKLASGMPVFNAVDHTFTSSGYTSSVKGGEGKHALMEIYRNFGTSDVVDFHLNGGAYPYNYSSRKTGWGNIGKARWLRPTNESGHFIPGADVDNTANNRPLPNDMIEGYSFMDCFKNGWKGAHVIWRGAYGNKSDGQRPNPGELNWNNNTADDQGTDGSYEVIQKAYYRLSKLGDFLWNDGKRCLFTHAYRNDKAVVGDRLTDAPIMAGKIAMMNGQMTLGIAKWWPSLRAGETRTGIVWVNNGSNTPVGYSITQTGRSPAFRMIPLESGLESISARDVFWAEPDLTGVTRLFRGELNVAVPAGTVIPGTVGSTPASSSSVPPASSSSSSSSSSSGPAQPGVYASTDGAGKLVMRNNLSGPSQFRLYSAYGDSELEGQPGQWQDGTAITGGYTKDYGSIYNGIVSPGYNYRVQTKLTAGGTIYSAVMLMDVNQSTPPLGTGATSSSTPPGASTSSSTPPSGSSSSQPPLNVVVNGAPLPESAIGLYSISTHSRDFGNGPEDNSKYEYLGLNYIENSDGIKVDGLDPNKKYTPPYIKQFKELATANNVTDVQGAYVTSIWSDFKIGTSKTDTNWQPGGIAAGWKRYMNNLFGYFKANGMLGGLAIWAARAQDYPEFLPGYEKGYDNIARTSNAGMAVPAVRMFSALQPTFNPAAIDTSTSAGRFLSDERDALTFMRSKQIDGSLTFIMIGTHTNGELGYDTRQDDPPGSWTDFHPEELNGLRTHLQSRYANLGALNAAWGSNYSDWSQITYPYSGNYGDFQGTRGLDCNRFRHIQLGNAIEVMCKNVWSVLPGIVIVIQFGQPFGGQAGILATMDTPYLIGRAKNVADSLNYTHHCIAVKYNPISYENHQVRGDYMRYAANQALGYSLVMHEDSYEVSNDPNNLTADIVANAMADSLYGAHTGRSGDAATATAVLFSGDRWAGVNRDGNPVFQGNTVKDMFVKLWSIPRRKQAAAGIGTTDPNKTITITQAQMQIGQGPGDLPWFERARQDWVAKGGATSDVKFVIGSYF